MLNIQDWNNIKADEGFKRLPAGGHRCVIKAVENRNSKSGKPMLVICFDIADGSDYAGYFLDLYAKNVEKAQKAGKQAKWPNGGIFYQLLDEERLPRFKAVIQNIEASNPGYKFNMDEKTLVGKMFGGVFREEEYESQKDGSIKTSVKCNAIRKVEGIEDIPVPKVKRLEVKDGQSFRPVTDNNPLTAEEIPF